MKLQVRSRQWVQCSPGGSISPPCCHLPPNSVGDPQSRFCQEDDSHMQGGRSACSGCHLVAGGRADREQGRISFRRGAELDKVAKAYGGGPGIDMTAFPDLKFADLVVD